jgi:hypothetical protein
VPANGESWFLARAFALARHAGFEAVVAYSDPETRHTAYGQLVFGGHIGTIYQASNAVYTGKTEVRTRYYFADGALLTDRELTKLREKQKGWKYVAAKLREHGASPPRGDFHAWRRRAMAEVLVTRRHRGSHRYLWALDKKLCQHLPDGMTYPKIDVRRSAP